MAEFPVLANLTLEVEQPRPPGPHNLILNPNGDLGAWGWRGDAGSTGTETALIYDTTFGDPADPALAIAPSVIGPGPDAVAGSNLFPVTPGKYAGLYAELLDTPAPGVTFTIKFFNASGGVIEATGTTLNTEGTVRYVRQVPAGAVTGQLVITCDTSGLPGPDVDSVLRHITLGLHDNNIGLVTSLTYLDPSPVYTNVMGSVVSATITREDLNTAELTATIKDVALDPATTDLLRPGRRVRLSVTAGAHEDALLFLGRIDSTPTAYEITADDETKRTVITLRAVDDVSLLANTPARNGYADLEDVTNALELVSVVPWSVNGYRGQVANSPAITTNPDATALDQVVIARDTHHAFAWMTREGILNVVSAANLNPTEQTLTEAHYSAEGPKVTWDVDQVINDITITSVVRNAITGETTQVTWGPYQDLASVREWGVRHRDFTVQGIANDDATMRAWAAAVFATNAQPSTRVRSVSVPIREAHFNEAYPPALIDLYDLVRVTNTAAGIDQANRVTRIEHTIRPGDWDLELSFSLDGGSPAGNTPSVTPPVVGAGPPATTVGVTTPEKPYHERKKTVSQNLNNGALTAITWDTSVTEAGGITLAAGVFTVPRSGRYLVTATVAFGANANGRRDVYMLKNGAVTYKALASASPAGATVVALAGIHALAKGDTLTVSAQQSSGGVLAAPDGYLAISYLD